MAMVGAYLPPSLPLPLPAKEQHLENSTPARPLGSWGLEAAERKAGRSSVAGPDVDPVCPSFQVSPRAGIKACGKFRLPRAVVVVGGPS